MEAENTHTFSEKLSPEIERMVPKAAALVVSLLEHNLWEEKLIYSTKNSTSVNS